MKAVTDPKCLNQSYIVGSYGMTETSPISFVGTVEDTLQMTCGSVGRVQVNAPIARWTLEVALSIPTLPITDALLVRQAHTHAKVISLKGWIVHCGVPGELCIRGYLVMAGGYWQQPDKTVEAVDSYGWMHSGDLAVIDEAGFANIVGRIKELIIRGGGTWALATQRELHDYLTCGWSQERWKQRARD